LVVPICGETDLSDHEAVRVFFQRLEQLRTPSFPAGQSA